MNVLIRKEDEGMAAGWGWKMGVCDDGGGHYMSIMQQVL